MSRPTRLPPRAADQAHVPRAPVPALQPVYDAILGCTQCSRLRRYCQQVAREKKAAYRTEAYWGRPVPGFGDPRARILLIGLAPAAHGANRTGRVFTGDGAGGSGDFLMCALHVNGLATMPTSQRADDGLSLTGAYIASAARCAPPDNRPTPEELSRCLPHLQAEWAALPDVRVIVCLGRIAFDTCWRILESRGVRIPRPKPIFAHGALFRPAPDVRVIASYHPSRQNTQTGRLTAEMLADIFARARSLSAEVDRGR
jgi:uracil-DNA glycosylase